MTFKAIQYKSCKGWTLTFGKRSIELWIIPPQFKIPIHRHPGQKIETLFIKGDTMFYRAYSNWSSVESKKPGFLSLLSLPAGWLHWFRPSPSSVCFINFCRWSGDVSDSGVNFKEV